MIINIIKLNIKFILLLKKHQKANMEKEITNDHEQEDNYHHHHDHPQNSNPSEEEEMYETIEEFFLDCCRFA